MEQYCDNNHFDYDKICLVLNNMAEFFTDSRQAINKNTNETEIMIWYTEFIPKIY
jgi:hypothetical protein